MNTNKVTIIFTVTIILLIISVPTVYKVVKNHNNNLYQVVEDKVLSAAKRCYYEEKCIENKISLKDLYNLNYLENVSNPITKEYYNEESYILRENTEFTFIIKE